MRKLLAFVVLFVTSDGVSLAAPVAGQAFDRQQESPSARSTTQEQKQKPKKAKKQKGQESDNASGYSKEDMLKIQKILRRYDYYDGVMDGKLNDDLKQAIRDFQDDENLPKTGELDEETYRRIISLQGEESGEEPPRR
jgi:peptidoglycan hydrolase-like protein with peptidoglycan-binding domain